MTISGIETTANKMVFEFAKKVREKDPRISCHVEGMIITGSFRGKSSETYEYNYAKSKFIHCDSYDARTVINELRK